MCDFLNSFDFSSNDAATISAVINDVTDFLQRAEAHMAQIAPSSPPSTLGVSQLSPPSKDTSPIAPKLRYNERFLDGPLLKALKKDLPKFDYIPTGTRAPEVSLFGNNCYVYNKATRDLKPTAITEISTIGQVLDIVNSKLGKNYNSVLVNKYRNRNVFLDWHKDDEREIDSSVPICSLSIGATRRFMVSNAREQANSTQYFEIQVGDNSTLVMNP